MKARHVFGARRTTRFIIGLSVSIALSLCFVALAQAVPWWANPPGNKITNPDFETGTLFPWFKGGSASASVGVENCCGQHNGFWWPNGKYNTYDTWDGYIWNNNKPGTLESALAQSPSINANQRYRLSAWMSTSSGFAAYLKWYANNTTNSCSQTNIVFPGYANVSCEFTPNNTTNFNAQIVSLLSTSQWVVSDDWALTALEQVPQSQNNPKRIIGPEN
jgi:hypothetical protein